MIFDVSYQDFITHLNCHSPIVYCVRGTGNWTFFTCWQNANIRFITTVETEHDFLETNYKVIDLL